MLRRACGRHCKARHTDERSGNEEVGRPGSRCSIGFVPLREKVTRQTAEYKRRLNRVEMYAIDIRRGENVVRFFLLLAQFNYESRPETHQSISLCTAANSIEKNR